MIQGKLGLSVRAPELTNPTQVVKMTPRHVNKWLESLPVANISNSSKKLYQLLLECNKSDLSDDDRHKILTLIHPSIQLVLKSLSKHFTGHTLSLSDKQKKIAALVQAIHTEMAIGYKIVIEHQAESPGLLKKHLLHSSIFAALEYLSLTTVRCYQVYTDVPARIWKEINLIYRFAIEQKLNENKIVFENFSNEHSVDDIFKKTCLLAVASPYQLRQQEIELIFNGLQRYVEYCKLEPASRFENRYVIDLNQHNAPQHQALTKTRPSQYALSMKLDRVVTELQNHLRDTRSAGKEHFPIGGLSARLIRHLLNSWAHLSARNFTRTPCGGQIKVSVGLNATFQSLIDVDDEAEIDTLESKEGSMRNATLVDDLDTNNMLASFGNESQFTKEENEDVWAKLYRPKGAMPDDNQIDYAASFKSNTTDKLVPQYTLCDADIVNISPGGYCISLDSKPPQQTQTGEIIGLVEEDESGQQSWHIGVIRWIKRQKQSNGLQLGIQLIAPEAKPIHSRLMNGKSRVATMQNALLLPELKGIGQPPTIITSPISFNTNQKLLVVDDDEEFEVTLTKLVSSSQGFRQFHFERVANSERSKSSQPTNKGPYTDGF
ncbi:MAG: hypothetical protein V2I33_15075, partial [Kangiellaceae bacterium]|nr:hypothetical protein [Kangiellaceae bacterium]